MRKLKFFADFDKEEAWLNRMATEGHLPAKAGPLYRFEPITPESAVVRVDCRPSMSRSDFDDYVNLFEDSGWRHLHGSRHGGPQYFASVTQDANADIFSDTASKAQRYRRSITTYTALLLPVLTIVFVLWQQGTIGLGAITSPKSWYLTPGLWEMEGAQFLGKFLFETIFVVFRVGGPLLLVAFCIYCTAVVAYQSFLYRKATRHEDTHPAA